jgi:hypothetical protein
MNVDGYLGNEGSAWRLVEGPKMADFGKIDGSK